MGLIDMVYRWVGRPYLSSYVDPEDAHTAALELAESLPWFVPRGFTGGGPYEFLGWQLKSPVGLAAGMDKNGQHLWLWEMLGFGLIEVGTITPDPQIGSKRPRVHRIPEHRALRNHMGFPSAGVTMVRHCLEMQKITGLWPSVPVGANVGPNAVSEHPWIKQYSMVVEELADLVDYFVLNVSSPNTIGLRKLQSSDSIAKIVYEVRTATDLPVFVKFSPDLDVVSTEASVRAAEYWGATGFIATNTTAQNLMGADLKGGISGGWLWPIARDRISRILSMTDLPVIGVGGVDSGDRAAELLDLGCSAVQLLTGLVYEGPGLPGRINRHLSTKLGSVVC